jgi:hypothetical protein
MNKPKNAEPKTPSGDRMGLMRLSLLVKVSLKSILAAQNIPQKTTDIQSRAVPMSFLQDRQLHLTHPVYDGQVTSFLPSVRRFRFFSRFDGWLVLSVRE